MAGTTETAAGAANQPPVLTEGAIQKAQQLLSEEGNQGLKLRVFITGGGCAGFQYGFSFDALQAEDDTLVECGGVPLLVDAMSLPYLAGSQVDYEEGLSGSRFVVQNPNAQSTCGCGSSFSL